jgi:hypothetical protein
LRAINEGKIKKLVIIVVNARSDPPNGLYQDKGRPGTLDMLGAVTSVPIDANTANSEIALTGLLTEIAKAAQSGAAAQFAGMKVYGIGVDFDHIPVDTPDHRKLRDEVKDVPTSWTLNKSQLEVTETTGPFLLRRNPCYREPIADLHAVQPAAFDPTAVPDTVCLAKISR